MVQEPFGRANEAEVAFELQMDACAAGSVHASVTSTGVLNRGRARRLFVPRRMQSDGRRANLESLQVNLPPLVKLFRAKEPAVVGLRTAKFSPPPGKTCFPNLSL